MATNPFGAINAGAVLTSGLTWFLAVGVGVILCIGCLWWLKQKRLKYPCFIFTGLGDGKQGVEITKAGWFKKHQKFFGLIQYGKDEYLKVKDGRRVFGASSQHFHDINGKRGLICKRKDDDPRVLVPIPKVEMTNGHLLMEIASSDLRDAAVDLVEEAHKETRNRTAEVVQWILMGGIIMFALISIIMITKMVQQSQREATELILMAGECGVKALQASSP